ncbi:hypothetical protein ASPVEDRAFT_158831 [Aspergillus versicolor CBS 583.65]|uniref:UBX domain-containing protein n=1 Tax=Aspergillus versicolor CBS 583.65 TaxID=1036611 RepID=A0A1L9P603_ASPVE|nr:uncharacterized protein ASPVEDRAFT_158831 [Aspergillus versicolor CBS 583.65]OJI96938.1 hypothetical protein ASPVEDRAFT_158831 [Aspergillus versicolor CBS 583.65]
MSSSGPDISELSESQRSALETYTTVTGQEPVEAIALLGRSQWNVQIAIAKFFDGEGPDPVEEARTSLENASPPRPTRQTQNLLHEDLTARFTPASPAVEPAPRIVTQPGDQPVYRPPFILALVFAPFNLLYRLFVGSFRLFGTLFPFLPRLLNTTASPNLQGIRRNTNGRRPLAPKDTAARFIREFEEEYGTNSLEFLENGYNMALEKAHRELKFLLVVLVAPEHDHTDAWVKDTLLSKEVTDFINDPQNNIIVWGGNVQDAEAYQAGNSLRCTKFPFAAAIAHTPGVSSTAMSVIARISGATSPAEFVEKLRTSISQNKEPLERIRATRAEQQASRSLREEQDSAYERSLAIDRERARQRREAEAARQQEEQLAAEQQAAEEKRLQNVEQWKRWRVQSIRDEPDIDVKDAVRISIRLLSGDRVIRRFAPDADMNELYAFVECHDIMQEAEISEKTTSEKPDGYDHVYGFRLVSPMPRVVYEADTGSIRDKIGRGGTLLVEPIDDESDED